MGEEKEEESFVEEEFEAEDEEEIDEDDIDLGALEDDDDDDFDADAADEPRPRRGAAANKRDDDLLPGDVETAAKANPKRAQKHQKRTRVIEGVLDTAKLGTPEGAVKAWTSLQKQAGDAKKRKYKMSDDFTENDVIDHPKFGEGYVVEIVTSTKVAVLFQDGIKKLAQNKV